MAQYPFVYISSLMRTGSTLLSEALSAWPLAYIFKETHMGKNTFSLAPHERQLLASYGVDMHSFLRLRLPAAFCLRRLRGMGYRQDYMIRCFRDVLHERIIGPQVQLGVKEVRHRGWENYVRHFPQMKVIMTGRDPRDIYLSAYYKHQRDQSLRRLGVFCAKSLTAELNQEFQQQLALRNATDCMRIKYEVLCTQPETLQQVKSFVNSPLPGEGDIGEYLSRNPRRHIEYERHEGRITSTSVNRWHREANGQLVAEAQRALDLMTDYCQFWGYE